jgi:hypothetical protein
MDKHLSFIQNPNYEGSSLDMVDSNNFNENELDDDITEKKIDLNKIFSSINQKNKDEKNSGKI